MFTLLFLLNLFRIIKSQKCPCSNDGQCTNFDTTLTASTLEQVARNFVDPRALNPKTAVNILEEKPSSQQNDVGETRHFSARRMDRSRGCESPKCRRCVDELSHRIFGGSVISGGKCNGLREIARPALDILATPQVNPIQSMKSENIPAVGGADRWMFNTESIGNSTNLKCDYKKGDSVDEQSPYVGLCSLCWSIRTLPENFTPRFINEKTCNNKDSDCLSKYGKCKQVYRSIDVLKNDASAQKPEWTQYTLNSPIGCECQVPQGSALINFVKK